MKNIFKKAEANAEVEAKQEKKVNGKKVIRTVLRVVFGTTIAVGGIVAVAVIGRPTETKKVAEVAVQASEPLAEAAVEAIGTVVEAVAQ